MAVQMGTRCLKADLIAEYCCIKAVMVKLAKSRSAPNAVPY